MHVWRDDDETSDGDVLLMDLALRMQKSHLKIKHCKFIAGLMSAVCMIDWVVCSLACKQ